MPSITTHAYIINNRFSNNPCDVPIVCGNYSVLGYAWFVRVSNVFSDFCDGYYEIGTSIPENYTIGHDPSEFIKLLHVQSGSTDIWVSETIEQLINACKCIPTNFTLIVDNGRIGINNIYAKVIINIRRCISSNSHRYFCPYTN